LAVAGAQAEVLAAARGPASASAAAEAAAVAESAAGCDEQGVAVGVAVEPEASLVAAGPAVEAEPGAGRPAVARIEDHRG
jgi:hypothetical protein